MAEVMLALFILGCGLYVVGSVFVDGALKWWRSGKPPPRMVECAACGKELPVAKAVIIHGEITADRDAYATTIAEYHRRCVPDSLT